MLKTSSKVSTKNKQGMLLRPKFSQKWILRSEFQKSKSEFGISTSKIACVPVFSQNGQLRIFRSNFGEITQLRSIFWFLWRWGCCRELGGSWDELGGAGWSWVEVDGARWRWVHRLAIPLTVHNFINQPFGTKPNFEFHYVFYKFIFTCLCIIIG